MASTSVRMLLQYQLPAIATLLFLLSRPQLCAAASHRRLKARRHFFYNEYKGVLKAANMTEFPEGDIRNLWIEGHEWTRNKNKLSESSEPEVATQQMSKTTSSTSNSATSSSSRRQRKKKEGQKSRKRFPKISKPYVSSSTALWRKKLFSMRKKDTEELVRAESNELASQPAKSPSTGKTRKTRPSRKERRRKGRKKFPRKLATKPIQGETTLSLNIAPLKQRCKTKPMKQEIKVQGCLSKSIMNNLCYGQCNSFYIPEIRGKGNGPPTFVSCGFCRPKTVRPIYVTLKCPNRRGRIRWKRKKVSYVKKCRCMEQDIKLDSL